MVLQRTGTAKTNETVTRTTKQQIDWSFTWHFILVNVCWNVMPKIQPQTEQHQKQQQRQQYCRVLGSFWPGVCALVWLKQCFRCFLGSQEPLMEVVVLVVVVLYDCRMVITSFLSIQLIFLLEFLISASFICETKEWEFLCDVFTILCLIKRFSQRANSDRQLCGFCATKKKNNEKRDNVEARVAPKLFGSFQFSS